MAFTYTITKKWREGPVRKVCGTYTSASGSTGGDIVTGLKIVYRLQPQAKGSAVVANAPAVNEDFPLENTGGTVTIVTAADEVGTWEAIGK